MNWTLAARNARLNFSTIREILKLTEREGVQRDAMAAALRVHLPANVGWNAPLGGMFFWLRLPAGLDATELLPRAVAAGVAYVPGAPFHVGPADPRTLRLSFVTLAPALIERAVAALGKVLHEAVDEAVATAPAHA